VGRQHIARGAVSFELYPPSPESISPRGRAPLVLMLHGMCSEPVDTCDWWSDAGRAGSFLICPAGNARCAGRHDWHGSGEDKARLLDAVLAETTRRYGAHLAEAGRDILMGFSRGAFVARDVAYARAGRYRGLVLIGAALSPDARRLRASGIKAVVLASGRYDGARPTMQRAAVRLSAAGLRARYMSTGKIWHQLPGDMGRFVREAVRWIREEPAGTS